MESCHIFLLSNILDFVPCDLQLQRAYCHMFFTMPFVEFVDCQSVNVFITLFFSHLFSSILSEFVNVLYY